MSASLSVSPHASPSPTAETLNDFCRAMSISRSHAYRLVRDGKLRLVKLGSRTLVPLSERARLLAPPIEAEQSAQTGQQ